MRLKKLYTIIQRDISVCTNNARLSYFDIYIHIASTSKFVSQVFAAG